MSDLWQAVVEQVDELNILLCQGSVCLFLRFQTICMQVMFRCTLVMMFCKWRHMSSVHFACEICVSAYG